MKVNISQNQTEQLISRDEAYFLRGLAIIMVVLSHYFEWGIAEVNCASMAFYMEMLGDPGVAIFFFLSGYAIFKGYGNRYPGKKYIFSRLKNFYIPYLIIAMIIKAFSGGITDFNDFCGVLYGRDFWFIQVMILIYLAVFVVGYLPKYRLFIITVLILDLSLYYYLRGYRIFWYDANWCFALGMLVSKYEFRLREKSKDRLKSILKIGESAAGKPLRFIGRLSLYIYLLHSLVYFELVNTEYMLNSDMYWMIKALICLLFTILLATVLDYVLKNIYKYIDDIRVKAGNTDR